MAITVKITGGSEIAANVARLSKALPAPIRRKILADAGEIIAERARELAPSRTGNLRDSIVVSDRVRAGVGQGLTIGDDDASVFVGPTAFYGHMVEFGTVKSAAHPFMRPAWDQTKDEVAEAIGEGVWGAIERSLR